MNSVITASKKTDKKKRNKNPERSEEKVKDKHQAWLAKQVVSEEVRIVSGQEVKVKVYNSKASGYTYEERQAIREEEKKKARSELKKQGRLVVNPKTGEECLVVSGYNSTKSAYRKGSLATSNFIDTGKGYKANKKAWKKLRKEGAAPLEAPVNATKVGSSDSSGYKADKKAWRELKKQGALRLEASPIHNQTEANNFSYETIRENKRLQRHKMYCTAKKCVCRKGLSNS